MSEPRTHPGIIRRVLVDAESTNGYAASIKHGLSSKTVYRWMERRAIDPTWPTDAQVKQYDEAIRTRGVERARKSRQRRDWAKRVYLARSLMQVDSLGTTRRLRALYALGWTSTEISARLDVSAARVSHLIAGRQSKVHHTTAARVDALYNALSMTVPQDAEHLTAHQVRVHDRQRRQSAAKGWAPPLAWDDIDDPDEAPTAWAYQPSARADRLAELLERGAGLYEVLRDLDLTRDTFNTWCTRHGHRDTYLALVAAVNVTTINQHSQRRAS